MVWAPRCQHWHNNLMAAVDCKDRRLQWLYQQPTEIGEIVDLGRTGAFLSLRQSGTATGPEIDLAGVRRRSAERERADRFVWGDPRNVGRRFALGLAFWGAYLFGTLGGNSSPRARGGPGWTQ